MLSWLYPRKIIEYFTKSNTKETNFINSCNNFLKKIKLNQKGIKIEYLNEKYVLYGNSNLKVQVIGKIEAGLNDIDYPDFVSIFFEDSKAVDDKNLKDAISAASKTFEEKGVALKSDYSLFIKEIGGFIVDGKLVMKYEEKNEEYKFIKFIYEFILKIKTDKKRDDTSAELTGILRLEIIYKVQKKPYIVRFNNKEEMLVLSTIILILAYEDKIPLIMQFLEIIGQEDKKAKNFDFSEMFKNLPQFEEDYN